MPTRLASLPSFVARLLLAALALLMVAGTVARPPAPIAGAGGPDGRDVDLYRTIAHDTAAGGGTRAAYYAAAVRDQRAAGYPLRPFVTVRQPALALLAARLGNGGALALYRLLALVTAAALAWRLRSIDRRAERIAATVIGVSAVAVLAQPALAPWHEGWAALLVTLGLALHRPTRWWPACLALLAAVLVREVAAPVLVAMLALAILERRRHEAVGWIAALTLFSLAILAHAHAVAALVGPRDAGSPGWSHFGGWGAILAMAKRTSLFAAAPPAVVALLVPLALVGWATRGDAFGGRALVAIVALMLPFMAIGRADNFYWGLMFAPLLPIGLAFAPRALADLVRAARQAAPAPPCSAPWTADASS